MSYPGADFDTRWRRLVCPPDYENPVARSRYHLAVIGAGPAGLVTAIAAAGLGARVALIEKHALGGDCLNVGCVPSKSLLDYVHEGSGQRNFADAFARMRTNRAMLAEHDSVARYTAAGVDVFLGRARFVDNATIDVEGTEIRARRVVIATGARAALPSIRGLAESRPLTNDTVFELREQPVSLAILGAGPIGCELAQAFARLGTQVRLIERSDRVLPTELPEASAAVAAALAADGVTLTLAASVERIARHGEQVTLDLASGRHTAAEILVAAGRQANVDELNLAAVNVATNDAGRIDVDHRLRTSNPRIFAAGDVCAAEQFTHTADAHARIVVQNALFAATASTKRLRIPHCTYTRPEVAQVGMHRVELERRHIRHDVHRVRFAELDRGATQQDDTGFAEVLTESGSDRILGATIVGADAGEQIAPICLAINNGIGLAQFAGTVLPYPTRAEYLRRLADNLNRRRLTPTVRHWMARWFRWTA